MRVIGFAMAVLLGVIFWSGQGLEAKIKHFQDKEGTLHITNEGEEEQKKPKTAAPVATPTKRPRRQPPGVEHPGTPDRPPGVDRSRMPRPSVPPGALPPPEGGPPPAPGSSLKGLYPESEARSEPLASQGRWVRLASLSQACFGCHPQRMTS